MGSLSSLLTKKQDKNMNEDIKKQEDTEKHLLDKLPIGAVMRSAFAVIPDAERLDIGSNKIIAVFQHRHQAEEWAKSMWEKFYLIEEVQSEHFS
jgi:hypothetical protein